MASCAPQGLQKGAAAWVPERGEFYELFDRIFRHHAKGGAGLAIQVSAGEDRIYQQGDARQKRVVT